jgi:hypothetical protein
LVLANHYRSASHSIKVRYERASSYATEFLGHFVAHPGGFLQHQGGEAFKPILSDPAQFISACSAASITGKLLYLVEGHDFLTCASERVKSMLERFTAAVYWP